MSNLENLQDIEKAILQSLFESIEKSPKHETQIFDDGFELRPGDKIIKKNGEYTIQKIESESGAKYPSARVFKNRIVHFDCIFNDIPTGKFVPYESKRLVLKEEISPYRLVHELAKEIEPFKGLLEINDSMERSVKMEEISLSLKKQMIAKRRHKSAIEKILTDKTTVNERRRQLDQSFKDFLLASAKENTLKTISDRMLWFYVATILVATGIETDTVDNVARNLQSKYRYQKEERTRRNPFPYLPYPHKPL
jgi:hypothetical protein